MDLYQYIPDEVDGDDDWGRRKIQEKLDEIERVVQKNFQGQVPNRHLKTLRKIDKELQKRRNDLNLDIPRKKDWTEGQELLG
jgi:hypothetical protein